MRAYPRRGIQRRDGYTLVEMLTALAIGIIVSAVAVPSLIEFQRGYSLTAAANQVAYDIARARMKAVGENTIHRLRIGSGEAADRYWLERSNDGVEFTQDGPTLFLPTGVRFASAEVEAVAFNRQGIGDGTVEILVQREHETPRRVQVTTLGRVRVL